MTAENQPTILAVDDAQDNLDLICEVLAGEPYQVITAFDAQSALQRVATVIPDVMLLDVQLPAVDGFELCTQLRAACAPQEPAVVFLTAKFTQTADVVHGLDVGGCDYITKPFDADELRARIRACVRRRAAQRHEVNVAKRITRRMFTGGDRREPHPAPQH